MKETNFHPEDQMQVPGLQHIIRSVFQLFFRFCDILGRSIVKGKFIILGGLLLGCLAGFLYYAGKKQLFQSSMLVKYNTLPVKAYVEIIDQLNQQALSGFSRQLAAELKISEATAGNIIMLETNTIYNTAVSDSGGHSRQFIKISVLFKHHNTDTSLQQAIITFLNNRPFVKTAKEAERRINTEKLDFINKELAKTIDEKASFNQLLAFSKTNPPSTVNPVGFYVQYLLQEKETTQRALYIDEYPISLVDGFKEIIVPRTISATRPVALGAGVGLLIGFIIAFLVEARKKLMPAT